MPSNRYRTKIVEVEATLYDGTPECADEIVAWAERVGSHTEVRRVRSGMRAPIDDRSRLIVDTLEGVMTVDPGDYVIRGLRNEMYPCKPDVFELKYERT